MHAICEDVRTRGLEAILELSASSFDGVDADRHPGPAGGAGRRAGPSSTRRSAPGSRSRSAGCARPARPSSSTDVATDLGPGARVTHRKVPVDRVGLYVPGGLAPLVVQRADERGARPGRRRRARSRCPRPPQKDHGGLPHPTILAACALLGVDEVYAVGGAQAIAMFAYGVGPCARVDLVTGPGNIWTVTAKRLLKGVVGIDSEAGPDRDRDPRRRHRRPGVRRRRPGQPGRARPAGRRRAGHRLGGAGRRRSRPSSTSRCSATKHIERIRTALVGQPVRHRARRRPRAGPRRRRRVRRRAPGDPHRRRGRRSPPGCATPGAIFVGPHAPVSLGDYCAGSNHVLPTGGCACHSSGLSVRAFTRSVHVVDYSREALGRGRRPRRHAGRGRGPARPRRRGPGAARVVAMHDLPAAARRAAGPASRTARPSSATSPGPAQRQREPLRPVAASASADIAAAVAGGRGRAEPLPRPGVRRAAHARWRRTCPATRPTRSRRSRCGRPTAPTR